MQHGKRIAACTRTGWSIHGMWPASLIVARRARGRRATNACHDATSAFMSASPTINVTGAGKACKAGHHPSQRALNAAVPPTESTQRRNTARLL